jgi:hypothetical protein
VCAVLEFVEGDNGSGDDGNACSDEGSGAGEEGKGSAGVEGNDSGAEGSGAACVDGAGSLEGSVGSDQGGGATSSVDSCACVARTTAKNIAATSADVLPTIEWAILAVVVPAARTEKDTQQ